VRLDDARRALVGELHQAAGLDGLTEKSVHISKRVVMPNDEVSGQTGREKASASGETQCAPSGSLDRLVSTRKLNDQKSE
jgi:hypothetical protein